MQRTNTPVDSAEIVQEIYAEHYKMIEKRRECRRQQQQKKNAKRRREQKKRKEEKKLQKAKRSEYLKAYELAVMNNDRSRIREIEKLFGGPPTERYLGEGYGNRNGKIRYSNFNPRPASGGRFTPK